MRRHFSRRPDQRIGERFLQQIDSAAEEDNGEETSQASKSARDAGPSYENISGMRGRAIFGRRGIGRHMLFLPSILQEKIRRECMKSILFAIPVEIEIAKDGRFVMLFHDRAATGPRQHPCLWHCTNPACFSELSIGTGPLIAQA